MTTTRPIWIRDAGPADHRTILDFNARLADETEGKRLDRDVLARGVTAALADPDRLRYWVAVDETIGEVIGQAAVTREWSDWRDGWIWWLQSVYVRPEYRGRGTFRALYEHVRRLGAEAADVIGFRLYVETENEIAHKVYQALGMQSAGYHVFEEFWTERLSPRPD